MRQRSLAVFLSLIMVMSLVPVSALAADETEDNNGTTIEVGTKEMLTQAFERVKNEESELWTIFLSDDIVLADKPVIPLKVPAGKTVTLLGNGYTITYNSDTVSASNEFTLGVNGGTLNLGKPDGTDTLKITTNTARDHVSALIQIGGDGTVNMYNGVTLTGNICTSSDACGVNIKGGTFNMYGGEISN